MRLNSDPVAVIGLGRFGKSLALELSDEGVEVLGIDNDHKVVQSLAGRLTHVVEADTTDEEAMRQLSLHEFTRAVIGIGNDLEASILSASVLLKLGVRDIWAKAISESHARILSQIGVHHVVRPEHDMGKRVAHLVRGRMLDYIEFDDGYAIVKTRPPAEPARPPLGRVAPTVEVRHHHRGSETRRAGLHPRDTRHRGGGRRPHHRVGSTRQGGAVQRAHLTRRP